MKNLGQPLNDLAKAIQQLRREWDQVRSAWTDQVASDFEKQTWSPLRQSAQATLERLHAVDSAINDIKHGMKDL